MTDALAVAILEELKAIRAVLDNQPSGDDLLTTAEVAKRIGLGRDWVYAHAEELGVIRMRSRTGQKPRLRFDPADVDAYLREEETIKLRTTKQARREFSGVEMLPVRGIK